MADALLMPFKGLFVIAVTGTINALTYNGHWWFKWVALGMAIAVLMASARAAKTLAVLALLAWGGNVLLKRYRPF